jgi:hypothetical protein
MTLNFYLKFYTFFIITYFCNILFLHLYNIFSKYTFFSYNFLIKNTKFYTYFAYNFYYNYPESCVIYVL